MRKIWLRISFLALLPVLFIQYFFCSLGHQFYPAIIYPSFAGGPGLDKTQRFLVVKTYILEAISDQGQVFPLEVKDAFGNSGHMTYMVRSRMDLPEKCLMNDACLRKKQDPIKRFQLGPVKTKINRASVYDRLANLDVAERQRRYDHFKVWLKQLMDEKTGKNIVAVDLVHRSLHVDPKDATHPREKARRVTHIQLVKETPHG